MKLIRDKTADNLEAVGIFVKGEAQVRVPVDTGNLKASINHEVEKFESLVRIGTPVEYAPFVELGTDKTSAQPYLRPAIYDNEDRIIKLLEL